MELFHRLDERIKPHRQPIEKFFEPMEKIDKLLFKTASEALNKPYDQLRLLFMLFFLVFLGVLFNAFVKGRFLRHTVAIVTGLACQAFMFRAQIVHPVVMVLVSYVLMAALPRKLFRNINLVWVLGYLSVQHIYRMMTNWGGWDMDVTTFTMLLTCRLWSIGFVISDGIADEKFLNDGMKQRRMAQKPSLLEFLSYSFFGPASIMGPFFEIRDYLDFIELKGKFERIPFGGLVALRRIGEAMLCLGLHIGIMTFFPLAICGQAEMIEKFPHLWQRIGYIYISMTGQRFMYYNAWKMSEAAQIAAGLAFNGKDKNGDNRWDGVLSIDVRGVELASSCAVMVKNWNHTVHLWLNNYVFERTFAIGKKPSLVNNLTVYMVSAFWHGFYPAYYVMFFQMTFLAELTKDIFKMRHRFNFIPWPLGAILANFASMLFMNYQGVAFSILDIHSVKQLAVNTKFYWYLIVFPAFFVIRFSGIANQRPKPKTDKTD